MKSYHQCNHISKHFILTFVLYCNPRQYLIDDMLSLNHDLYLNECRKPDLLKDFESLKLVPWRSITFTNFVDPFFEWTYVWDISIIHIFRIFFPETRPWILNLGDYSWSWTLQIFICEMQPVPTLTQAFLCTYMYISYLFYNHVSNPNNTFTFEIVNI